MITEPSPSRQMTRRDGYRIEQVTTMELSRTDDTREAQQAFLVIAFALGRQPVQQARPAASLSPGRVPDETVAFEAGEVLAERRARQSGNLRQFIEHHRAATLHELQDHTLGI